MDDTFGGVIIGQAEPSVIVAISNRRGPSGFSGFSGSGGGGGGSSFSGFSGFSGGSGPGGNSGFSGFSSFSGYSGYSGIIGGSGFSGYSGSSGISGAGGGNSGYSGYSGPAGTFTASGFSGYSGFSARSGFSGYSGSGVSGFSGYSAFSGYSGFSGFGSSGFSGFSSSGSSGFSGFSSTSGFSGYSGGPSGFSGFSGTGSPPGGAAGDYQYNNGAGGFAASPGLNLTSAIIRASTSNFRHADSVDPTKLLNFDLTNIPTGTTETLLIPNSTNPVAVASVGTTPNQFVTAITALGVVQKAQPDFSNLTGLAAYGQLDRSTLVVAETATLTIAANTKVKSTASGTLTTISFSGGNAASQGRRLDLDITGGPYTLTIPSSRRIGETGTITSIQVFAGYNEFSWEFINGEYVMSDSVTAPGGTASGFSGFSGGAGAAGSSGFSGYSGPTGAGSSGFSGFSGPGSSGFSGYSAPQLMAFTTHNDTDWTLVMADAGTGIKMASAAAHNIVVPLNASVAFPIGTQIAIEQGGSAAVGITAAGGVTLQGAAATIGLYSVVVLIKQATDTWLVTQSGLSGYSGYSGGVGSAGASGFSGFSGGGPSGFSGFSGPGSSGFSGYSSLSGFSGFSGKSGYSGYSGPQLFTFSTQIDVDYTLVLGDANTGVKMSSGAPHTLTVPTNASVAFAIGTQIAIEQGSSGIVTLAGAGGVTLQGSGNTAGQFSVLVLIKQATDTWLVASGNSGYSGFSGLSGYSGYSGYSGFSAFSGFSGTFGWTKLTVAGSDATATFAQGRIDVTGLVTGTLTASTLYEIHARMLVLTSADNNGIQYAIHCGGTGAASIVTAILSGTTTTNGFTGETISLADTPTLTTYLTTGNIGGIIDIKGFVTTRSTGTPTISIQHMKITSGTSTVKIGSYLEYRLA